MAQSLEGILKRGADDVRRSLQKQFEEFQRRMR